MTRPERGRAETPPEPSPKRDHAYRRAALAYAVLGSAVVLLTVLTPELARPERRADLVHLAVGLPIFFLFAGLIAWGDRAFAALARPFVEAPRAIAIGGWLREKLVMVLCLTAAGRTFVLFCNGIGLRPRLGSPPQLLRFESVEAEPRLVLAAVLMASILVPMVRASWIPFLRRRSESRRAATPPRG